MSKSLALVAIVLAAAACTVKTVNPREQPYFAPVAQTLSFNQELNQRLGSPLTFGKVTVQRSEGDLDEGSVTLDVEVSGPTTKGHAVVAVSKASGRAPWMSKGGSFFPVDGPPIHLDPR